MDRRGSLDPERNSALSKLPQIAGRLKKRIEFYLNKIFSWNFGPPKNQHGIDSQTRQTETLQGQPKQGLSSEGGQQPDGPKISRRGLLKMGVVVLAVCYGGYYNRIRLARLMDTSLFSPEKLLKGVSLSELLKSILDSAPRAIERPVDKISENFAKNLADPNTVRKIEQFRLFANPFYPEEYILPNPSKIFSGAFLEKPSNSQPLELHPDLPKEKGSPGSKSDSFKIGEYLKIAGFDIITDARGLWDGQQEYCVIFVDDNNNYLAIGYEGGLYGYDFKQKQWCRLIDSDGKCLQVEDKWRGLNITLPKMSEQVISGLALANKLGYPRYPIVRGDVQMPEMNEKAGKFMPEHFYSEKNLHGRYLFGKSGEIIDLVHAGGMAEKLVLAVIQMLQQYEKQIKVSPGLNEVSFEVSIPHFEGEENFPFEYQCKLNVKGLNEVTATRAILLIGFLLIQETGFLLETVSQRAVRDMVSIPIPLVVGMTPEDMYSNSLGMWLALNELLQNPNREEIAQLKDGNSRKDFLNRIKEKLVKNFAGETPTKEVGLQTLGMYPFIPVVDPVAFRAQDGQITNPFLRGSQGNFQAILADLKELLKKAKIQVTSVPYLAYNVKRADNGIR